MSPRHFALTVGNDRQDALLRLFGQFPAVQLRSLTQDRLRQGNSCPTRGIELMDMVRLIKAQAVARSTLHQLGHTAVDLQKELHPDAVV